MQMPQIVMESQYALHDIDCKLLTQYSRKALGFAGVFSHLKRYSGDGPAYSGVETLDIFRTLAQHQDDISAYDLNTATLWYRGPPEGVNILLAHSSLHFERFEVAKSVSTAAPLAVAVRGYSRAFFRNYSGVPQAAGLPEYKKWEPLIERLIHKGANLHGPLPRYGYNPSFLLPFHVSEYETPLDVLFQFCETSDEAKSVGAEWLGLLASKGHDVVAYLKEEMILHAQNHQMTYAEAGSRHKVPPAPRELQFLFEDTKPCVWWDWWTDPASKIDLLERELKQMVKHTCVLANYVVPFLIDTWPFQYPVWYDNPEKLAQDWLDLNMDPAERRRRAQLAMQRANRRLEKRYARSTYSKALRRSQMPGAWPASSWE